MPYTNTCKKCNHEWATQSGPGINCPNCDAHGGGLIGFKYVESEPESKTESPSDTVKFDSKAEEVVTGGDEPSDTGDEDFS